MLAEINNRLNSQLNSYMNTIDCDLNLWSKRNSEAISKMFKTVSHDKLAPSKLMGTSTPSALRNFIKMQSESNYFT